MDVGALSERSYMQARKLDFFELLPYSIPVRS